MQVNLSKFKFLVSTLPGPSSLAGQCWIMANLVCIQILSFLAALLALYLAHAVYFCQVYPAHAYFISFASSVDVFFSSSNFEGVVVSAVPGPPPWPVWRGQRWIITNLCGAGITDGEGERGWNVSITP